MLAYLHKQMIQLSTGFTNDTEKLISLKIMISYCYLKEILVMSVNTGVTSRI